MLKVVKYKLYLIVKKANVLNKKNSNYVLELSLSY